MSRFEYSTSTLGKDHPDFKAQWVQHLLADPDVDILPDIPKHEKGDTVSNSLFSYTLAHESGIRARINFERPCKEADSTSLWESCALISVGWGIDGRTGRGHGGFSSLLLDEITGTCAHRMNRRDEPPATATMAVDYKAPVSTPCVLLCRSWPFEISGRKIWLKGVIEDHEGKPYATGKALFINPRESPQKMKL